MVNPLQVEVLKDNPKIHKIIRMRRRRFWRVILDCRKEKFDLAITLNKKFSASATFFALCSNAKMMAGYLHPATDQGIANPCEVYQVVCHEAVAAFD